MALPNGKLANTYFVFEDRDKIMRAGNGRKYVVDGVELDLFPLGVLSKMLWRSNFTIYGWEKNFNWPRAMYRLAEDSRKTRWYSRKQLLVIRELYKVYGSLFREHRWQIHEFIAAVRQVFYTCDVPLEVSEIIAPVLPVEEPVPEDTAVGFVYRDGNVPKSIKRLKLVTPPLEGVISHRVKKR